MCGRATVINPDGITEKFYGYTKKFVPSDWKPRYNLNPRGPQVRECGTNG